jgi:hypothetical protein
MAVVALPGHTVLYNAAASGAPNAAAMVQLLYEHGANLTQPCHDVQASLVVAIALCLPFASSLHPLPPPEPRSPNMLKLNRKAD